MLENMRNQNGSFELDGYEYILAQHPYLGGTDQHPYYRAIALRTAEAPDSQGWQTAYEVRWNLRREKDTEPAEDHAPYDLKKPFSVEIVGKFNLKDRRFF